MLHQRDENFMMLTSWKTGSRENRAYTEAGIIPAKSVWNVFACVSGYSDMYTST